MSTVTNAGAWVILQDFERRGEGVALPLLGVRVTLVESPAPLATARGAFSRFAVAEVFRFDDRATGGDGFTDFPGAWVVLTREDGTAVAQLYQDTPKRQRFALECVEAAQRLIADERRARDWAAAAPRAGSEERAGAAA